MRPAPLRYPPPSERQDGFLRFVEETCRRERPDAVLTLDEDIVRLLAESPVDLAGAALAGPDAAQYEALCDKGRLAETARLAGVDHPHTVEVDGRGPRGASAAPASSSRGSPDRAASGRSRCWRGRRPRDDAVGVPDAGVPALVQERLTGRRWVGHCVRGTAGSTSCASRSTATTPARRARLGHAQRARAARIDGT